jgi:hypothetical protein
MKKRMCKDDAPCQLHIYFYTLSIPDHRLYEKKRVSKEKRRINRKKKEFVICMYIYMCACVNELRRNL